MSRPSLQFDAARARTDALFELLDPVALYDRPVPERHRLIFYLGHLEAFDWVAYRVTPARVARVNKDEITYP